MQRAFEDVFAEGFVLRDAVKSTCLGLASIRQKMNQTQSLTLTEHLVSATILRIYGHAGPHEETVRLPHMQILSLPDSTAARDRVAGVLVGIAAGDLYGGPLRMALHLAESLIACGEFNASDVLSRHIGWFKEGAFDTGPVAENVLARIAAGEPPEVAVRTVHEARGGLTAGCNAAHRCAPLAMAHCLDDGNLRDAAVQEAALTHFDPLAGDVSAAVVVLCRSLIIGDAWADALALAARGRKELTQRALCVAERATLSTGGYAPNVLAAAIHFVDRHRDFGSALDASFEFAGGGNYCPVLVGAIGGARWGQRSVPAERLQHAELLPRVRAAAECLAESW